jgi:hypothetical protein
MKKRQEPSVKGAEDDVEFAAMRDVYASLKDLQPDAQDRVLDYVFRRLGLARSKSSDREGGGSFSPRELAEEVKRTGPEDIAEEESTIDDALSGVNSVAQKWIRRNGLTTDQLSELFSLGLDTIDVVARSVPGKSTREKMHNVILLTGAAAYLGTGAARMDSDTLKEALSHYNAYDHKNLATYLKEWASEVSGTRQTGFTLTARGLAGAAELVKEMTTKKNS